ncbi:MAG: hypothetical protein M1325_04370 [Actinobacteria bacterium]|nr:hypothetical protein [Actinomycetota bacterium]
MDEESVIRAAIAEAFAPLAGCAAALDRIESILKHGTHDQKTHGNWARGKTKDGGSTGRGKEGTMRLYRATDADETGLHWGQSWTPEKETAQAYTDNPGFGGPHIRSLDVDTTNSLDLRSADGVDFKRLAEALGYEDADETAREWRSSSWRYPWEESATIQRQLRESGYDWIVYLDDYPDGATTYMYIGRAGESKKPAKLTLEELNRQWAERRKG